MAPGFDEFVRRVEQRVLSECEALAQELRAAWPAFDVKTFSHRHVDVAHALGLWCAVPGYRRGIEDDSRGIIINLTGIHHLSARGFVEWNRPLRMGNMMITVSEVATRSCRPRTADDLGCFFQELPTLYDGLRGAMRRTHLPDLSGREWDDDAGKWYPALSPGPE
jgi:hypothetical protein